MANELIRLLDPDSAHAVEETAKAAGRAIDAAADAGKYAADLLGDLPRNVIGVAGDWVRHKRIRREAELREETERILHERKVNVKDRNDPSPSVVIPLLAAAIDEDRDGLKELWAKLLAATFDPARSGFFRAAFVDAAKRMDPLDARVLQAATAHGGAVTEQTRAQFTAELHVSRDEVDVSISNLLKLDLLVFTTGVNGGISAFGREFLRAVK